MFSVHEGGDKTNRQQARMERERQRWQEVKLTVDSGACDHVINPAQVSQKINTDTPAVRNEVTYRSASGHPLPNLGEVKLQGTTQEGGELELTMQVAGVKKPLASVRKMCKAGNRVVFDDEGDYVQNKASGTKIPITQEDGTYQVSMWVPITEEQENTLQGNMFAALGKESESALPFERDVFAQEDDEVRHNAPGVSSGSVFPRRA
jgi:hypothetical protein